MAYTPEEWLTQADYDFQTAEFMFSGERYVYVIFMAHLSIEKALKGVFQKKFNAIPPKTHNLVYFVNKTELTLPENINKFLVKLNQASVATRYPEDFLKLQSVYTKDVVREMLISAKETLEWVKRTF